MQNRRSFNPAPSATKALSKEQRTKVETHFYSTFSLKASKRWLRMQNVYVNSYHCNVQILLHKVVTK